MSKATKKGDPAPATPDAYLAALPDDRRAIVEAIRETVNANLAPGFAEGIQYGMIGWFVPHSVYAAGYHCDPNQPLPFASVASQKSHVGIYLFCLYMDEQAQARFVKEWKATGAKLDMGKACVRVKKLEDVPLGVLGDAIARVTCGGFIEQYERQIGGRKPAKKKAKTAAKTITKKTSKKTVKKAAAKKAGSKKVAGKASAKKTTRKAAAKPAGKKMGSKTTATKKAAPKKAAPKKTASKKPVTKKPTSKKPQTKKPAAKKIARKPAARR